MCHVFDNKVLDRDKSRRWHIFTKGCVAQVWIIDIQQSYKKGTQKVETKNAVSRYFESIEKYIFRARINVNSKI